MLRAGLSIVPDVPWEAPRRQGPPIRDVLEWLATFPFPPIPITSFPFPIPFP